MAIVGVFLGYLLPLDATRPLGPTSTAPQPAGRFGIRKVLGGNVFNVVVIAVITVIVVVLCVSFLLESRPPHEMTTSASSGRLRLILEHRDPMRVGDAIIVTAEVRGTRACSGSQKGGVEVAIRAPGLDTAGPDVARRGSTCVYRWLVGSKHVGTQFLAVAIVDDRGNDSTASGFDVQPLLEGEATRNAGITVLVALLALLTGRLAKS